MSGYAATNRAVPPVDRSHDRWEPKGESTPRRENVLGVADLDAALGGLIAGVADRIAAAVVRRLELPRDEVRAEWLDSRAAAEYLGVHRDTVRLLAAERAIRSEQDGPGCKLYFLRSELDAWRRNGGRSTQLAAAA